MNTTPVSTGPVPSPQSQTTEAPQIAASTAPATTQVIPANVRRAESARAQAAPQQRPTPAPFVPSLSNLSQKQQVALSALAAGRTAKAAAALAGVDRNTLYRWRRQDPYFAAALNAWRNESLETARDRLLAMLDAATRTLHQAIRDGNVTAAAMVLKDLGALSPASMHPDTPENAWATIDNEQRQSRITLGDQTRAVKDKEEGIGAICRNSALSAQLARIPKRREQR